MPLYSSSILTNYNVCNGSALACASLSHSQLLGRWGLSTFPPCPLAGSPGPITTALRWKPLCPSRVSRGRPTASTREQYRAISTPCAPSLSCIRRKASHTHERWPRWDFSFLETGCWVWASCRRLYFLCWAKIVAGTVDCKSNCTSLFSKGLPRASRFFAGAVLPCSALDVFASENLANFKF